MKRFLVNEARQKEVDMFVNLTPHEIKIFGNDRKLIATVPPSGTVARVKTVYKKVGIFDLAPLFKVKYEDIEGVPSPKPGVMYIVSNLVKNALPDRNDVASPGQLIRDENGKPIGCIGLRIQ